MILTPAQNIIASDAHRFRVVNCGRQFGKTTLAIEEIKGFLSAKPSRCVYVATTIQQARDIAWTLLKKELSPIALRIKEAPNLEIEVRNAKGSTSLIQLKGWEAIETLRGQQFDFIVLDEVASMKRFWSSWQEVLLPTLSFRKGHTMFISTPKGYNHFYDLYNLELSDNDFKSFHFTSYHNPYLSKEEIDLHKSKSTSQRFSQEYLAEFSKAEGLVYKEFDRNTHIFKEEIYGFSEILGGVDFGFTNPSAVLSIGVKDDYYYVLDELYKTGLTDGKVAEYTASKMYNKVYPDPESASAIEEMRQKGINVREVVKGKDSIKNGINKVRELLMAKRLKIHPSCVNLIAEFESYSYPETNEDRNDSELPVNDDNHALDALRYALMTHSPAKRIIQRPFHDNIIDIWRNK